MAFKRFNSNNEKDLVSKLNASLAQKKARFDASSLTKVCSMESEFDETGTVSSDVLTVAEDISRDIAETVASEKPEMLEGVPESVQEVAMESATIAAASVMGAGGAAGYMTNLINSVKSGLSLKDAAGSSVSGQMGITQALAFSAEAFTEQNLKDGIGLTVSYNLAAAIQQEVGATLYPTIVVDPSQIAYAKRTRILESIGNGWKHAAGATTKGDRVNATRRNLVEGYRDAELFGPRKLRLIPVFTGNGATAAWEPQAQSNARFFASDDYYSSGTLHETEGLPFYTRPLRLGQEINMLSASQRDDLQELYNQTDMIDGAVALESVDVAVTFDDGTDEVTEVFRINVAGLAGASYNKSASQDFQKMDLNAVFNTGLGAQLTVAGQQETVLTAAFGAPGTVLNFELAANGTVNLETGESTVRADVNRPVAKDANDLPLALPQGLTIQAIGYTPSMNLTNDNLRFVGHLVSTREWTDYYTVGVNTPVSIQNELTGNKGASDVDAEALQQAANLMISNNCISELLMYADRLKNFKANRVTNIRNGIDGAARHWMKPYYHEDVINVRNTASLNSASRMEDIAAQMQQRIRWDVLKAVQESELIQGIQSVLGGQNIKWSVIAATEQRIKPYLLRDGSTQDIGQGLDMKVVQSFDSRLDNKIYVTVADASGDANSPAVFGNMLHTPTPVARYQRTTGNATYMESTTLPRFRHIQNIPLLIVYTVEGLSEAIDSLPIITSEV